jgi:hypothetical protein
MSLDKILFNLLINEKQAYAKILHAGSKGNLIFQKVDENRSKGPIQAKRPDAIPKNRRN